MSDRKVVVNLTMSEDVFEAFERAMSNENVPRNAFGLDDDELSANVSLSDVGQEVASGDGSELTRRLEWWVHNLGPVRNHRRAESRQ